MPKEQRRPNRTETQPKGVDCDPILNRRGHREPERIGRNRDEKYNNKHIHRYYRMREGSLSSTIGVEPSRSLTDSEVP